MWYLLKRRLLVAALLLAGSGLAAPILANPIDEPGVGLERSTTEPGNVPTTEDGDEEGTRQPAPQPFPPRLQRYLQGGIDNGRLQAVAAGWIDRGQTERVFLGNIGTEDRPPRASDAFELGSTTRVFTGLLLAQALLRGETQGNLTLGEIFAEIDFADPMLAATSLQQLATQNSGLAALPANLFPRNINDPLVDFDDAALHQLLRHGSLTHAPSVHTYSDTGVALLGAALARIMGEDFPQLVATHVLAPLDLHASGFGSVPGLLRGHYLQTPVLHWQYQTLAPAGGMRATLDDLLTLARHNLFTADTPERAALLLARQPLASAGGGLSALGWQVVNAHGDGDLSSWPIIWQAGVSGGFASFIGFRTDRQRALVLLGNARTDLSAAGLALLADQELPEVPARWHDDVVGLPVGLYALDDGSELLLRATEEGIDAQLSGGWPVPLHNEGDGRYRFGDTSRLLSVFAAQSGDDTPIMLLDRSFNLHGRRLSLGVPTLPRHPRETDAQELAAYVGTYGIEGGAWLRVSQRGEELFVQPAGRPAQRVQSHAIDRFSNQDGWMQLQFLRDADNVVSGLELRAGLLETSATRLY